MTLADLASNLGVDEADLMVLVDGLELTPTDDLAAELTAILSPHGERAA